MRRRIARNLTAKGQRMRRRRVSTLLRLEGRLSTPTSSRSSFAPEAGVEPYHGFGVRVKRAPPEEPLKKRRLRGA